MCTPLLVLISTLMYIDASGPVVQLARLKVWPLRFVQVLKVTNSRSCMLLQGPHQKNEFIVICS